MNLKFIFSFSFLVNFSYVALAQTADVQNKPTAQAQPVPPPRAQSGRVCSMEASMEQMGRVCSTIRQIPFEDYTKKANEIADRYLFYNNCGISQITILEKSSPMKTLIFPSRPWVNNTSPFADLVDDMGVPLIHELVKTLKPGVVGKITGTFNLYGIQTKRHVFAVECATMKGPPVLAVTTIREGEKPGQFFNSGVLEIRSSLLGTAESKRFALAGPDRAIDNMRLLTEIIDENSKILPSILQFSEQTYSVSLKRKLRELTVNKELERISFWYAHEILREEMLSNRALFTERYQKTKQDEDQRLEKLELDIKNLRSEFTKIQQSPKDTPVLGKDIFLGFAVEVWAVVLAVIGIALGLVAIISKRS